MNTDSKLARLLKKKYETNNYDEMKVNFPVHTKGFKELIEKEVSLFERRLNEEKTSNHKGGNK